MNLKPKNCEEEEFKRTTGNAGFCLLTNEFVLKIIDVNSIGQRIPALSKEKQQSFKEDCLCKIFLEYAFFIIKKCENY